MKILAIGGSGLIGSKVVTNLRQLGYEVLVGSPSTGVNTMTTMGLADLMRRYLTATGDQRVAITDANAAYYGAQINNQSLTPGGDARIATTGFSAWLSKSQSIQ